MNKYLCLILSFIIFESNIKAQPFGANNAAWHFSIYNYLPPLSISPVKVTSSPAFLFNGDTCRTIYVNNGFGCMMDSTYIVKESNDSVYYYLPGSSHFVMLYNYNAAVGDTQSIYGTDIFGLDTSVQMVVTGIGTTTINGSLKRTYDITYATPGHYFDFAGTVVEDIGNTFFLFPQLGFCDPIIHEFRCYEDSVIGLYQVYVNLPCDSIIWLTVKDPDEHSEVLVGPNPFSSGFSFTLKNKSFENAVFTLYDILGREKIVIHEVINSDFYSKEISSDFLPKGIYLLSIKLEGIQYLKKLIKN